MEKINKTVIILAGGKGRRMNSDTPKQFLQLTGKPVLMHTILKFYHYDRRSKLIVVLPFNQIEIWNRLCSEHRFIIPHQIVTGGEERFFSVQNGLYHAENDGLIALHDGVRPLVSEQVIENCFITASRHGAAIPVINPTESVRVIDGGLTRPFDRNKILLVQTPQTFRADLIKKAYQTPFLPHFTDDSTVFEASGDSITIVEGNVENIKITHPADLLFAEALIKSQKGY